MYQNLAFRNLLKCWLDKKDQVVEIKDDDDDVVETAKELDLDIGLPMMNQTEGEEEKAETAPEPATSNQEVDLSDELDLDDLSDLALLSKYKIHDVLDDDDDDYIPIDLDDFDEE